MAHAQVVGRSARRALAGIRIINGALGLAAPELLIRRLGDAHPERNAAAVYGLRLFGIRTILIGVDLLTLRGPELERAVRRSVLIHASDTATAATLAARGRIPATMARPLVGISALNTVLAVTAVVWEQGDR